MKYRIIAVVVLGLLVANLGGSTFADSKAKRAAFSQLVSLLPASDALVTLDAKRFFNEAMPQVLSANPTFLGKITGHMEEIRTKIGVDVRQFDDVVVGISARHVGVKNHDVDMVAIARGQSSAAAMIEAAKSKTAGKFREERVGSRVMYIFEPQNAVTQAPPATVGGSLREVGVVALDDRTIAFGDVVRVRQTLQGNTKIGADLSGMVARNPAAIASFAAKPPAGLSAYIPLSNDELGKNIESIQYIYGNANVVAGNATVNVTARTQQNAQATGLLEAIEGLQIVGKAILGGSKAPDKRVYARLIESAKLSVRANELTLDLTVPQSDIDVLVGTLK